MHNDGKGLDLFPCFPWTSCGAAQGQEQAISCVSQVVERHQRLGKIIVVVVEEPAHFIPGPESGSK